MNERFLPSEKFIGVSYFLLPLLIGISNWIAFQNIRIGMVTLLIGYAWFILQITIYAILKGYKDMKFISENYEEE